jgi:hypothetical protein
MKILTLWLEPLQQLLQRNCCSEKNIYYTNSLIGTTTKIAPEKNGALYEKNAAPLFLPGLK